jgi:retinol dehydrogenase 12
MKTALITGANSGLGLATAKALAVRGFDLILLCRNEAKGRPAVEAVQRANPAVSVDLVTADLTDLDSVRRAAETVKSRHARIDVLINNAGYSPTKIEFVDGIEKSFFANHIGHFVLTQRLLPVLENHIDESARIISLSSSAYQGGKKSRFFRRIDDLLPLWAYCDGKLANLLFAKEAAKRFSRQNIRAYSVHPGVVRTNFGSDITGIGGVALGLMRPFLRSPEKGAETTVYLASAPLPRIGDAHNGGYFADLKPQTPHNSDITGANAAALWTMSESFNK